MLPRLVSVSLLLLPFFFEHSKCLSSKNVTIPLASSNSTSGTPTTTNVKANPRQPLVSSIILQRPFYNIAHMVNSLPEVDEYLKRGANALSTDIYFAPNATPVFTFHGFPCDCFRHCAQKETVHAYLDRIRMLTTPGSVDYDKRLVLLFLDLKLARISHSAKALAGQNLASTLIKHLYVKRKGGVEEARVRTIISLDHVFDYDFVLGFQAEMESQERSWLFKVGYRETEPDFLILCKQHPGESITLFLSFSFSVGIHWLGRRDERSCLCHRVDVEKAGFCSQHLAR